MAACTLRTHGFLERSRKFIGMEPKWPGVGLKDDPSASRNQVEPVGPSGVGFFHAIVEPIDKGGEPDAQVANAGIGYRGAFRFIPGTSEENLFADIALHLPDVGGMSLQNVDGVEIGLTPVLLR